MRTEKSVEEYSKTLFLLNLAFEILLKIWFNIAIKESYINAMPPWKINLPTWNKKTIFNNFFENLPTFFENSTKIIYINICIRVHYTRKKDLVWFCDEGVKIALVAAVSLFLWYINSDKHTIVQPIKNNSWYCFLYKIIEQRAARRIEKELAKFL